MCLSSFAGLNIRIVVVSLVGFHQFDGNFHFILSHTHIQTHKAPKQTNKIFFAEYKKKYYPFLELVVVAVQWVRQLPLQFFFYIRNSAVEILLQNLYAGPNEKKKMKMKPICQKQNAHDIKNKTLHQFNLPKIMIIIIMMKKRIENYQNYDDNSMRFLHHHHHHHHLFQ